LLPSSGQTPAIKIRRAVRHGPWPAQRDRMPDNVIGRLLRLRLLRQCAGLCVPRGIARDRRHQREWPADWGAGQGSGLLGTSAETSRL